LKGAKAPTGDMVKLEALRLGSRWVTSSVALQRFCEALTPSATNNPVLTRTPKHRRRAVERAEQELKNLGI
jgi:hypothetical protein